MAAVLIGRFTISRTVSPQIGRNKGTKKFPTFTLTYISMGRIR